MAMAPSSSGGMNSVPTNGVSAPATTSNPSEVRSARLGYARKWSSSRT